MQQKKKHMQNKILNSRLEQQVHTFKISNDPIGHTIKIKITKWNRSGFVAKIDRSISTKTKFSSSYRFAKISDFSFISEKVLFRRIN